MKYSIEDIGPIALGLGIAIIMVSIVAMILPNFYTVTYQETLVANQTFDNSTTLTVQGGLVSWTVYNDTTQNYPLTSDQYVLHTNNGTLIITNDTAKEGGDESVKYIYNAYTNATLVIDQGMSAEKAFADWFNIIVIVVVSIIILGLVMLLRKYSGGRE